jgi:hypothetical protein
MPAVRLADRQPAQVSNGGELSQTNAFVPLVYSSSPFVGGQIVRLEVPRAAVERFGLAGVHAVEESRPGTVLADVFVGDDGLARAVRFVQPVVSASGSRLQETQR